VLSLTIFAIVVRRRRGDIVRPLALSVSAFFISAIPWLVYARPWGQLNSITRENAVEKLFDYLKEINFHIFPFALALIPAGYFIYRRFTRTAPDPGADTSVETIDTRDMNLFLLISIPCHLPAVIVSPGIFMRYIIVLVPVFCLLQAYITIKYARPAIFRYGLVAVLCLTNYLSYYPAYFFRDFHQPELPLFTLVHDISSKYSDALDDVVAFLKKEGAPDESILVKDPEFPLIFYTGMEVIDYNYHTEVFFKGNLPDWIFPVSISGVLPPPPLKIPDEVMSLYEPVTIPVRNSRRGANMPEPDKHISFSPLDKTDIVVYKKKSKLIRFLVI
jgi:hypothetical protein